MNAYLCCGVAGPELDAAERSSLERVAPRGVVLFARNIVSREQLIALVNDIHGLPGRPYVAVDLEGGRVNRLRGLLGALPSAAQAAATGTGAVAALGRVAGAACASLRIDVDFAPVVDVARPGGWLDEERRCFGSTPGEVAVHASLFLESLESYGVSGCLKHYPGLGSGGVDSHRSLPLLADDVREEMGVFEALSSGGRAVMVAHALAPSLGEAWSPTSLSRCVLGRLRRHHRGPILADDLEMGALEAYGSHAERAAAALLAGCDQVLVCNAMEAREDVVGHVESWRRRHRPLELSVRRSEQTMERFATGEVAAVRWSDVEFLADEVRRIAPPTA